MSNVYFISDLHLGHKRILDFAGEYRDGETVYDHDQIIVDRINETCSKKDILYILGDVCMTDEGFSRLFELKPQLRLVKGNHDLRPVVQYNKVFQQIHGIVRYKDHWLSHCPLHPDELRGRNNIHGHVHKNSIRDVHGKVDDRYINVCVENNRGYPVAYKDIESKDWRQIK